MNKAQRTAIHAIHDGLVPLVGELEERIEKVSQHHADEEGKYENMPEGLKASENGQKLEEIVSNLDTAKTKLEEARDALDEAINALLDVVES